MTDISFILGARDDGYMGDFINRFEKMLENNISIINDSGVSCEIIVVDFNPFDEKYLYLNSQISKYLSNDIVKNIIVDRSILITDYLNGTTFYEYFAKNIGARRSLGQMLFFTNADIIITKEIIEYIKNELSSDRLYSSCYRCRYRIDAEVSGFDKSIIQKLDLCNSDADDAFLVAGYSGDATFMHRNVFIETATGYDERSAEHRTPAGQSSMDGEILWNLHYNNINIVATDLEYYHVNHQRSPEKDGSYLKYKYINRENWGFIDFPTKIINENTIMIYSEEYKAWL